MKLGHHVREWNFQRDKKMLKTAHLGSSCLFEVPLALIAWTLFLSDCLLLLPYGCDCKKPAANPFPS